MIIKRNSFVIATKNFPIMFFATGKSVEGIKLFEDCSIKLVDSIEEADRFASFNTAEYFLKDYENRRKNECNDYPEAEIRPIEVTYEI